MRYRIVAMVSERREVRIDVEADSAEDAEEIAYEDIYNREWDDAILIDYEQEVIRVIPS